MKSLTELSYKFVSYLTAMPPSHKSEAINMAMLTVFGIALFALCCVVGSYGVYLP